MWDVGCGTADLFVHSNGPMYCAINQTKTFINDVFENVSLVFVARMIPTITGGEQPTSGF